MPSAHPALSRGAYWHTNALRSTLWLHDRCAMLSPYHTWMQCRGHDSSVTRALPRHWQYHNKKLGWGVLGSKIWEVVARYWLPNKLVFPFGVFTSVPTSVNINQEMRPWECSQTDRYTYWQTDRLTDANRFYNLSHAICYSYGTDKHDRE